MEAVLIAQHRRPALVIALFVLTLALVGCQEGVSITVVGVPVDARVSVDSLSQAIARVPSKIYRYQGVGYARIHGVPAAASYLAIARSPSGCVVSSGVAYGTGEDEVQIDLKPVSDCQPPPVEPPPVVSPDMGAAVASDAAV